MIQAVITLETEAGASYEHQGKSDSPELEGYFVDIFPDGSKVFFQVHQGDMYELEKPCICESASCTEAHSVEEPPLKGGDLRILTKCGYAPLYQEKTRNGWVNINPKTQPFWGMGSARKEFNELLLQKIKRVMPSIFKRQTIEDIEKRGNVLVTYEGRGFFRIRREEAKNA